MINWTYQNNLIFQGYISLGVFFGVILFLDGDGKDRKDTSFSIIMNHSADIPSSWILVEKDCTASTWIDYLIKQFERAKKWMKI